MRLLAPARCVRGATLGGALLIASHAGADPSSATGPPTSRTLPVVPASTESAAMLVDVESAFAVSAPGFRNSFDAPPPMLLLRPFAVDGEVIDPHTFDAPPVDTGVTDDAEQDGESWLVPSTHGLALMTGMRLVEAAIWPDPFASTDRDDIRESYEDAYTRPPVWDSSEDPFEWDGDRWSLNVVGHGLFGSELYLRARTCGKNGLEAFAFTAAGSTLWEYGFEANAVRPSGLDLWYTPLAGVVLGEARYWAWRAAGTIASRPWRAATRALLDPFGELERAGGAGC